jgi:hypothetical protein
VNDGDLVIPVKSHLDGDPNIRPEELIEWNALRRQLDQDELVCIIVLGKSLDQWHSWVISEPEKNKVVIGPGPEIRIQPDEGTPTV